MRTIQVFRLAATLAASYTVGRHKTAKRAVWALLSAVKASEARDAERIYRAATAATPAVEGEELKAWRIETLRKLERGSVSLPLLAFQACAAIGLASGVASVVAWAQGVLGGVP